jgi:hypothetical protein
MHKSLKRWCRMQDSNPRPSVYKFLAPHPIYEDFAVFRRLGRRFNPGKHALIGVRRFALHPRAVVASSLPLVGRHE